MEKDGEIEAAALGFIRSARRTCEQLGDMGLCLVHLADWLEIQIPRVRSAYQKAMKAAEDELRRPDSGGRSDQEG